MKKLSVCAMAEMAISISVYVTMYTIPDFPAKDILNALAVGIASGLASTGANQIVKQLSQSE